MLIWHTNKTMSWLLLGVIVLQSGSFYFYGFYIQNNPLSRIVDWTLAQYSKNRFTLLNAISDISMAYYKIIQIIFHNLKICWLLQIFYLFNFSLIVLRIVLIVINCLVYPTAFNPVIWATSCWITLICSWMITFLGLMFIIFLYFWVS